MPGGGTADEFIVAGDEVLTQVRFDQHGLVPVIAQDVATGAVLMLAYADREALTRTLDSGVAHYRSRSRDELWRKGATSGNEQRLQAMRYDCDADAVLYLVEQSGVACHTGEFSCFHNELPLTAGTVARTEAHSAPSVRPQDDASPAAADIGSALTMLERVIAQRIRDLPDGSYVRRLHERGVGYVAQKVIEEAGESVVAALQEDDALLVDESADLLFHLTMLLRERGVNWSDVAQRLLERNSSS